VPFNEVHNAVKINTPLFQGSVVLLIKNLPNTPKGIFDDRKRMMWFAVQVNLTDKRLLVPLALHVDDACASTAWPVHIQQAHHIHVSPTPVSHPVFCIDELFDVSQMVEPKTASARAKHSSSRIFIDLCTRMSCTPDGALCISSSSAQFPPVCHFQGRFKQQVPFDTLMLGSEFQQPLQLPAAKLLTAAASWLVQRMGSGVELNAAGPHPFILVPLIAAAQVTWVN
jgi:hypothetical protein